MNWLSRELKKIRLTEWVAAIAALTVGLVTHLYMLTNKMPNGDDIGQFYADMDRASHGRWFLKAATSLSGKISIPFNGVIGMIYLAAAAMLLTRIYHISGKLCGALIGAIVVLFPSITGSLFYMQCADAYFLAILLAVASVLLARNSHYVLGTIALTISMGIYQAYFPYAAAILVSCVIIDLVQANKSVREIFSDSIKYIAQLVFALAGYFAITKICVFRGAELIGYMGIENMGKINLQELPHNLFSAFVNPITFFLKDSWSVHGGFTSGALLILWGGVAVLAVCILVRSRVYKDRIRSVLLLAAIVIFPLSTGLIWLMGSSMVHHLMIYAYSVWLIMAVWVVDYASQIFDKAFAEVTEAIAALMVVIVLWNYAVFANKCYFTQWLVYEQSYAFSERLVCRIEEETTLEDKQLVLIGYTNAPADTTICYWYQEESVSNMTGPVPSLVHTKGYNSFLQNYMGVKTAGKVEWIFTAEELQDSPYYEVQKEMGVYPAEDSIVVVDDKVVVKFRELE